jgi:membrane-bound lytic murein transglycosylase D
MKNIKTTAIIATLILISGLFIFAKSYNPRTILGDYFPENADFAGEAVPLQIADVAERMDKEMVVNIYLQGGTTLILKRANKVFPVIEPILKRNGVPDDFKYLAVIESGLINAVSPAGARGIWQFMPETAKEKGMEVTENVDERYHLEKSTEAACRYLLDAKARLGSWTMAAASYNGGMNGINKQIEIQKVNNYYDLLLNEETSRYVFRILALKEIMKNPTKFGFNLKTESLYNIIPTKRITVDTTINDLASFAIGQGINYKILKIHNPWLREKFLTNKNNKIYQLEIPTRGY